MGILFAGLRAVLFLNDYLSKLIKSKSNDYCSPDYRKSDDARLTFSAPLFFSSKSKALRDLIQQCIFLILGLMLAIQPASAAIYAIYSDKYYGDPAYTSSSFRSREEAWAASVPVYFGTPDNVCGYIRSYNMPDSFRARYEVATCGAGAFDFHSYCLDDESNVGSLFVNDGKGYGKCQCAPPQVWDAATSSCVFPKSPYTGPSKNFAPGNNCPASSKPISFNALNKYLVEYDDRSQPSQIFRVYNSLPTLVSTTSFGSGWVFVGQQALLFPADGSVIAVRKDGKSFPFVASGGLWTADRDINDQLVKLVDSSGGGVGWRYTTSEDEEEIYNVKGQLLSITNRQGHKLTFTYSDGTAGPDGGHILNASGNPTETTLSAGQLIRITNSFGRSWSLKYDGLSRIVKMLDPANGNYLYKYDTNNNLSSVTYPDGKTKTYLYGEAAYTSGVSLPHALTGVIDENGVRTMSYLYGATGRAISEFSAGNFDKTTLTYSTDTSGNPISTVVTDPLGTSRTYNFTTILGVVKSTGTNQPGGSGCGAAASNISYDANGNVATRTDFNGNVTTYGYDLTRNLETSRTEAYGTPLARTITTAWHPTYRLPIQITEPGRKTTFTYDPSTGNLLNKTITDTATGATRTWTYAYTTSADGTLAALLKTIDGPRTDVSDITTYNYYPNGDLKTVTNALGHITQITSYDANGRPLTLVDPNNILTTLTYKPRGWLESRTVAGETTTYGYDNVGQLTKITFPDASFVSYTYDNAHRLTDITDALGNRIHYTLDNIGNRTKEDIYDNLNNLTQTKSRVFDALNRLWKDIGALNQTTLYTYDPNGNLTSSTDPLSHTTVNSYDALNRLTSSTDALAGITRYDYDPLDQLKAVTDPRNLTTSYTVNALGDQSKLVSPDTGTTTNSYDAAGNLKTKTDANGNVTTYTYDALNRLTKISYSTPSFPPIAYQYDSGPNALGKLSKMTDESGSTSWTYNAQGRVASQSQVLNGVSLNLSYGYDSAGRLSSLSYPSGRVLTYGYDAQGRVNRINIDGAPLLSNISYQAFGLVQSWTWSNGLSYSRSFDQDGRIVSYPLGANVRALAFDAASRISGYTDTVPAANQLFDYDNLDRLTRWIAPSTNQSYNYDANGNRTHLTISATPYAYTVNPGSNRLNNVAGPSAKTYSYDAAGHITGDGSRLYLYTPAGFMYGSLPSTWPNPDVTFNRNGMNLRVQKTAAGISTLYRYDNNNHLIGEYTGSGSAIQETIYLGDQPIGILQGTQRYYIFADHLNTPRLISNTANQVRWKWDSDPFGTDVPNENPAGLGTFTYNLRFPGQYFDKETGLSNNYYRDYDPGTGRYLQSDPIGLAGGLNTYAYVEGNPIQFWDAFGLVKHTTGKTISCGRCTIRIDYTFDEKTSQKTRHLHWNCNGKEGSCGEYGDKSHGGSWDDAPENVKECARKAGFQGDPAPDPAPPAAKVPSPPWWAPLILPALGSLLSQ